MKTVGIIGGFGPETTAQFYLETIFGCFKKYKISRPPIIIWSAPLKYKIEENLLKHARGEKDFLPYLIKAAKILEKGGANFLVMPCNSLHIFIEEIRKSVSIPMLSIIEETIKILKKKKLKKIGLLATGTTLNKNLYQPLLKKENISCIIPNQKNQKALGIIISNIVRNRHTKKDEQKLLKIINELKKNGAEIIVLACTDLQIIAKKSTQIELLDTMKILSEATIKTCTKKTAVKTEVKRPPLSV